MSIAPSELPQVASVFVDDNKILLAGIIVEETEVEQLAASTITTVYSPPASPETF
jgi:hypothetical protein